MKITKQYAIEHFIKSFDAKWDKGEKEHGGSIEDRNLNQEAYNEALDLVAYLTAQKEKKKSIQLALEELLEQDIPMTTLVKIELIIKEVATL